MSTVPPGDQHHQGGGRTAGKAETPAATSKSRARKAAGGTQDKSHPEEEPPEIEVALNPLGRIHESQVAVTDFIVSTQEAARAQPETG